MKTYCVLRHKVLLGDYEIADTDDEQAALDLAAKLRNEQEGR